MWKRVRKWNAVKDAGKQAECDNAGMEVVLSAVCVNGVAICRFVRSFSFLVVRRESALMRCSVVAVKSGLALVASSLCLFLDEAARRSARGGKSITFSRASSDAIMMAPSRVYRSTPGSDVTPLRWRDELCDRLI